MQNIIAIITLSWPLILFFYCFPALLLNPIGPIIGAIILGIYIWYLNYKQHTAAINGLLYSPSGAHKELFESWIRSCNIDPTTINLKYAYTAQQIAMAMGNLVIIDPTCCSICDEDASNIPVINVFTQMYAPNLNTLQKQRQDSHKELLTPAAQCFIFKHELGHVADNYSYKKLWVIFTIGTVATYIAILVAKLVIPFNGVLAICVGVLVGTIADILLTYASNLLFKVSAEKRADIFAAQYSSIEEITAAAHFFEKDQEIINIHKDPNDLLLKLPLQILSGHPDGTTRKTYLLKLAAEKKS